MSMDTSESAGEEVSGNFKETLDISGYLKISLLKTRFCRGHFETFCHRCGGTRAV